MAAAFLLLLIVIGFYWKLTLTNQYSWLQSPDLAYQVMPWFQYEATQFHRLVFPMWDPFQFLGQSLIGQAQPGLAYPINWILFALPLRDGHINVHYLNWYYVGIHYLAALFCYLLCRDLGRSRLASLIGGISFALGGYIGNTSYPQIINGATWAPLVFLFLFRALRGVRPNTSAALCGVFLGVSWLSGHHIAPLFLSLATLSVWLYSLFERGRIRRQLLAPAAVFLIFLTTSGAFQIWPTLSYARTAVRWVGSQHDPISWNSPVPYTVHQQFSLSPKYLLGIVVPGYDDGVSAYVGIVALALTGLALAQFWRTKEVRILLGVGIAGLLLALGNSNVFHGILYSLLPIFGKAREPMNALYLMHFAIAILMAFGMDALLQVPASMKRRLALILLSFGIAVFFIILTAFFVNGQKWTGDDRVMITVLVSFAISGLIFRMSRAETVRRGMPILIVALYLLELGNDAAFFLPNKEEATRNVFLGQLDDAQPIADFLLRQPTPARAWVNRDDVPFNFGDWYGIDTLDAYVPSVPADFFLIDGHSLRGRAIFAAPWAIGRKPFVPEQKEIFRAANGLAVFASPDAMPRVWTVHEAVKVTDQVDARRHLYDPAFDLSQQTFLYETSPALENCTGDSIGKTTRGINQTTTIVTMNCRGMVIMSENNAPGWLATVDGHSEPVYSVYTTLRGVVANAGKHTIEMRYRPLSVIAGAISTLIALLTAFVLWLAPVESSKPPMDAR